MEIHFILVEPAIPEHTGATARAMKTMGFKSLRIVKSKVHEDAAARRLAHGSADILEQATVWETFTGAIAGLDFIIGTTSKKRKVAYDYAACGELPGLLEKKGKSVGNVAIVFGSEKYGLDNAALRQCDIVSYIPMVSDYPSLNLSQAVMVYAYILSPLIRLVGKSEFKDKNHQGFVQLKDKVDRLLEMTGLKKNSNLANRINERMAVLGDDDIHLLHSICNALINSCQNN